MPHSTLSNELPASQTCLIQSSSLAEAGKAVVMPKAPLPTLTKPYDVLVQVQAVALNPTDYKMPVHHPAPGAVMGCDFAGKIIKLGSQVADARSDLSTGIRICGWVHGSNPTSSDTGAFAEYLVADARLVLRVPSNWSEVQAAAMGGLGWGTLGLALFASPGLGLAHDPARPIDQETKACPVLVYGGATATGTMASQLLKLSGYSPITVNSPASNHIAASYGAAASVSYLASDPFKDLKTMLSSPSAGYSPLKYALDCISSDESAAFCHAAIARTGGRYAHLEYLPISSLRRKAVQSTFIMGYEVFGQGVVVNQDDEARYTRDADETKLQHSIKWCRTVQKLLDERSKLIKCHPPRVLPGKWQGIIDGLETLRKGEVRGEKLVVRIVDQ